MRAKFITYEEYSNMSLRTKVSVFVEPELLLELYPKEYKKLMYLIGFHDITGTTLVEIYKYGGKKQAERLAKVYAQILYAIEILEQKTRDFFGEIKIGKIRGTRGSVFYVDYDPNLVDNYAKYNMKIIPSIEEI